MIRVFTDGATVGHNGKLGTVKEVGIGVYSPELEISISERLPGISNNEAEFKALIRAMEECASRGVKQVQYNLDSQIVVNRANGSRPKKAKFKNERMDAFQDRVIELSRNFDKVEFNWIRREMNWVADSLSKKCC